MPRTFLSLALLVLIAAGAARAQQQVAGPATVLAGDRLVVAGQSLRLVGIVVPAEGQRCLIRARLYDCAKVSATALMDLTAGVPVICRLEGPAAADGARPARCRAEGYDLSEGMVYTGWALADPATGSRYAPFQDGAKAEARGLWKGRFVMPWDWAQGRRLPEEAAAEDG